MQVYLRNYWLRKPLTASDLDSASILGEFSNRCFSGQFSVSASVGNGNLAKKWYLQKIAKNACIVQIQRGQRIIGSKILKNNLHFTETWKKFIWHHMRWSISIRSPIKCRGEWIYGLKLAQCFRPWPITYSSASVGKLKVTASLNQKCLNTDRIYMTRTLFHMK